LRRIAEKLIDWAEEGDLPFIHELVDRLDGRSTQTIDCHDVQVTELSDVELYLIASGGRAEVRRKPCFLFSTPRRLVAIIGRRIVKDQKHKPAIV
jgi:hypothetical protein